MKKKILSLLILFSITSAMAHDFEVDGIYYNIIDETNNTVEVTYRGSYYDSYYNEYTGSVVIPESVTYDGTTYNVTAIGDYAFYYCRGLTEITIPNSVTSIGNSAFYYCTGLTSVTIPGSVTEIGGSAFSETPYYNNMPDGVVYINNILYKYKGTMPANTTIEVREGTVSISSSAFRGCTGLTSVTIPGSVTSIGDEAFRNCTGLTSITIPKSVTSIGDYAFYNCYGLTEIIIQGSVTSIGDYAFYSCYGLTEITIPNSVTSIGNSAFYYCTGLTEITIPNSVTSIGSSAFRSCGKLTSVTIPGSVTSIGNEAFYGAPYYNNMPDGVVYINNVLYEYKGTMPANTTIEVREGTVSISSYAFSSCTSLTSITIPNSVTTIGLSAFEDCTGLTSITIPESVTSIGEWAFLSCTGLTEITCLATTPPTIYSYTFNNVSKSIPVNVPAESVEAYQTASYWSTFTDIQAYEKIETENVYYLDCNGQNEWAVDENSIVEAVFTNVITGYETTVQGSVMQSNDGTSTYTSVLFYLAEGNSYVATEGVENALYTHIEFKLANVTRSEETTLTTGALYLADADKPIYRLVTDEWVAYDPKATGIDDALAEDAIIVRGDVVTALGDIYVYNMSGAMVAYGRDEIDLSALQRGIYLIHAGGTVKKVVK